MRYHLITLGCPKNVVDSEGMAELLDRAGYRASAHPEEADVLIVNTCGFIGPAKAESVGVLRKLAARKQPGQVLIAAGCLVQRAAGDLVHEIPGLDAVLSTRRWYEIAQLVADLRRRDYGDIPEPGQVAVPLKLNGAGLSMNRDEAMPAAAIAQALPRKHVGASAYLKIADGCSAPCAFCTIPGIKGPWRSKSPEAVVAEAQALVAHGVKEIILIAQDTTAYGYDWGQRDQLAGLLEKICAEVPDLAWLRLMYAFPGRVTPRLIETMARQPQVVHYLDMPLQHGHPAVLARMRRPSDSVARRTVHELRAVMPDIAIRTGFIVGYPGETEAEFQGLLDFVEALQFDKVGVFTFCPEAGTPAAELPDQIPEEIKQARRARVMELQQRISLKKNRKFIGQKMDVLVEGAGDGISVGRTYRDAPEVDGMVIFQCEFPVGEMVRARITGAMEYDLLARPEREMHPQVELVGEFERRQQHGRRRARRRG